MKTILILSIFSWVSFSVSAHRDNLVDMQQRINQAFYASFAGYGDTAFAEIESELMASTDPIATYWYAYAKYYKAIYLLKMSDRTESESELNEGIESLEGKKGKSSEDYALLAMMQNFSVQFVTNAMKMGALAETASDNTATAIKLDPDNLRAYLAAAYGDFYKPAQYGGGQKAEKYLLTAIRLDDKSESGVSAPTWGKDSAYALLIRLYLKAGNKELARKYSDETSKLYPDNYELMELKNRINR